jgi:acyl carrier protein
MLTGDGLRLLEETLELPPHSLTGRESLAELRAWDSLSTMGFIAAADRKFGVPLPGSQVYRCKTVAELIGLLETAVAKRAA